MEKKRAKLNLAKRPNTPETPLLEQGIRTTAGTRRSNSQKHSKSTEQEDNSEGDICYLHGEYLRSWTNLNVRYRI